MTLYNPAVTLGRVMSGRRLIIRPRQRRWIGRHGSIEFAL